MKSTDIELRTLDISNIQPYAFSFKKNFDYRRYRLKTTLHWHDHYEIEFITGGHGVHIINDRRYELSRGSAYLVTPTDFHTVFPASDSPDDQLSLYNFRFGDNLLPDDLQRGLITYPSPIAAVFPEEDFSRLIIELEDVRHEYKNERPFRNEMLLGTFERIMIRFYRQLRAIAPGDVTQSESQSPLMQRAVAYIKYNFRDENLSVGMLADRFHLSPNYFGELFRQSVGMSCMSYIKQLRLDFARGLLVNSDLPVNEIGARCGYSSPSYFIREFNGRNGISPSGYRKKMINENNN